MLDFWIISSDTDFKNIKNLKVTYFIKISAWRPLVQNFTGKSWKSRTSCKTHMLKKWHIKSRLDFAKTDLQSDDDYFKKNLWSDENKIVFLGTTMLPMFGERIEQPAVRRTPSLLWNTVVVTSWFVGVLSGMELKNIWL